MHKNISDLKMGKVVEISGLGFGKVETTLNRQDVDGLGLILGQNFITILPTFISEIEKTFYLKWNGPENSVLSQFENK